MTRFTVEREIEAELDRAVPGVWGGKQPSPTLTVRLTRKQAEWLYNLLIQEVAKSSR